MASAKSLFCPSFRGCGSYVVPAGPSPGRLYCTERALWKLNWFLRDFGYDPELFSRDQVDEKALLNLRGVVRTSPSPSMVAPIRTSNPSLRRESGTNCHARARWNTQQENADDL